MLGCNIFIALALFCSLVFVACSDSRVPVESIKLGATLRDLSGYSVSEQRGYRTTLTRDSVLFLGCPGALDLTVDSFSRPYRLSWFADHMDSNVWIATGKNIHDFLIKEYGPPDDDTLRPMSRHRVGGRPEVRSFIWFKKDWEIYLNLVKADYSIEFQRSITPYN